MLKGIDPRLNADVLHVLRMMGHGDVLIIADTNFPSDSVARATVYGNLLRMATLTAAKPVEGFLSAMPVGTFVDDFVGRMEIVGGLEPIPAVQAEVQQTLNASAGAVRRMISIWRIAFYDMARQSYAVIQTCERRFYGCFMLRKAVIGRDA